MRIIGLKGVFDVSQFNKGLSQYTRGVANAIKQTVGAQKSLSINIPNAQVPDLSKVTSQVRQLAQDFGDLPDQLRLDASSIGRGVTSMKDLVTQFDQAQGKAASVSASLKSLGLADASIDAVADAARNASAAVGAYQAESQKAVGGARSLASAVKLASTDLARVTLAYQKYGAALTTPGASQQQVAKAAAAVSDAVRRSSQSINAAKGALSNLDSVGKRVQASYTNAAGAINAFRVAVSKSGSAGKIALGKLVDTGKASASIFNLAKSVGVLHKSWDRSLDAVVNYKNVVGGIQGSMPNLAAPIKGFTRETGRAERSMERLTQTTSTFRKFVVAAFAVRSVVNFKNSVEGVIRAFSRLFSQSLDVASQFERLQFANTAFIFRELSQTDPTASQVENLQKAKVLARGLAQEFDRLAIKSPFETGQIQEVFTNLVTRDIPAAVSRGLTKQIVDFGTAFGTDPAKLANVARAIGDIQTKGKLAGEEVRQLANAGIPIRKLLADNLGVTRTELEKMTRKGLLPSSLAIKVLSDFFKEFEGAAAASALTLTGLLSSLRDIKNNSLRDFFIALLGPLQEGFESLVNFFTDEDGDWRASVIALGQLIGEYLFGAITRLRTAIAGLFDTLVSIDPQVVKFAAVFAVTAVGIAAVVVAVGLLSAALGAVLSPIGLLITGGGLLVAEWTTGFLSVQVSTMSVLSNLSTAFSSFLTQLATWGQRAVEIFASGMAAAVEAVASALTAIGNMISYFLQPASPPRIVPDIDKWGEEAANIYLQGWQKADFASLKDFGSNVRTILDNLAGTGQIEKASVPEVQFRANDITAQAIDDIRRFGQVSVQTFSDIGSLGAKVGPAIGSLISRYSEVARSALNYERAQSRLNGAMRLFDTILSPLKGRLQGIKDQQQDIADEKELAKLFRILSTPGISSDKQRSTQLRIEEIQLNKQIRLQERQRDVKKDQLESESEQAKGAVDRAEFEIANFKERLGLQEGQNKLLAEQKSLLDQAKGAAGSMAKAMKKGLSPLERQLKAIQIQREELRDLVRAAELRKILESETATEAEKVAAQLELQELAIRAQLRDIEAAKFGVDLQPLRDMQIVIKDTSDGVGGLSDDLGALFAHEFPSLEDAGFAGSLTEFDNKIKEIKKSFTDMADAAKKAFEDINNSLPDFLKPRDPATGESPLLSTIKMLLLLTAVWKGTKAVVSGGLFIKSIAQAGIFSGALRGLVRVLLLIKAPFKALSGSIRILGVILAPLSRLLLPLVSRFSLLRGVSLLLGRALGLLTGPIGWVITAGWLLYEAYQSNFLGFRDLVDEHVPKINTRLQELGIDIPAITERIKKAWESFDAAVFFDGMLTSIRNYADTGLGGALTHVIQPEKLALGISGSISSAFSGMATSLEENITVAIGEALPNAINYLTETLPTQLAGVFSTDADYWKAVKDAVLNLFLFILKPTSSEIDLTTFRTVFLGKFITDVIPSFNEIGQAIIDGVVQGLLDAANEITNEKIATIFRVIAVAIKAYWGISSPSTLAAEEIGKPIVYGVLDGIGQAIDEKVQAIKDKFIKIRDAISSPDFIIRFLSSGTAMANSVVDGIKAYVEISFSTVKKSLTDMFDSVISVDLLGSIKTKAEGLGESVISGITAGLDKIAGVKESVDNSMKYIYDSAREWWESKSPSKKAERDIGQPITQGIFAGIKSAKEDDPMPSLFNTLLSSTLLGIALLVAQAIFFRIGVVSQFNATKLEVNTILTLFLDETLTFFTDMKTVVTSLVEETQIFVVDRFQDMHDTTISLVTSMRLLIIAQFELLKTQLIALVDKMTKAVVKMFEDMRRAVLRTVDRMVADLIKKFEELVRFLQEKFADWGVEIGERFGQGIADGILNKLNEIRHAAQKAGEAARKAAKDATKTASPSKVAIKEVGEPFSEGIAKGIQNGAKSIMDAAQSVMVGVTSLAASMSNVQSPAYASGPSNNYNNTNYYNLSVNTPRSSQGVVSDFAIMSSF